MICTASVQHLMAWQPRLAIGTTWQPAEAVGLLCGWRDSAKLLTYAPQTVRLSWMNQAAPAIGRTWRLAPSALALCIMLVVGVGLIAVTAGGYGISWDEGVQSNYGELVLRYFATRGADKSFLEFSNLRIYGPGFELLSAICTRIWPGPDYVARHVLSALAGLLTLPALYRIGGRLGSAWIGVFAGFVLMLLPRFYGHCFINSKDVPFACLFAWTMSLMLDQVLATDRTWARAILFGLVFGLMLSVRPAGVALVVVLAIALLAWRWRLGPKQQEPWKLPVQFAVAGMIGWIVMICLWPFALESPLLNPFKAIVDAVRFDVTYPVLFEGVTVMSDRLPVRYLPEYLLITTPPFVLLLAAIGLVASIRQQRRDPRSPVATAMFLAQAWLILPLVLYAISKPNVYDELRHFLFLLPAVALLAAIGAASVVSLVRAQLWRRITAAAIGLVALAPVASLISLHPYQVTYFNSFVGGLAGAAGRYETDYWITSYREAMEWIGQQAAQHPDQTIGVLVAAPKNALMTVKPFRAPNVRVSLTLDPPDGDRLPRQFTYYLATTRYGLNQHYPDSPIVHTIGRDGAIFSVVRAR